LCQETDLNEIQKKNFFQSLLFLAANRGGQASRSVQEGHHDRGPQCRQHGHRPQDLADQRGRRCPRQEGLGDDEAEGAQRG